MIRGQESRMASDRCPVLSGLKEEIEKRKETQINGESKKFNTL